MTILTPDQRLRIFVSSTLQELADERRAAREAIEGLRLAPVMFELGARPHPPRALYRAYVEQSDVFIGVYWQSYGWVAPGEDVSGLEDEYRSAGDRPKLIYLKEPAPGREPRLAELLARIRADDQVSYRRFSHADELRSLVADDLAVLLSERFGAAAVKRAGRSLVPPEERPLPRPLTRLIGRELEIEGLSKLVGDPSRRLVTILGPGGVGKTRVALAVAERLRDSYPDGVFFVSLAALVEPRLVIPSIAQALGISEAGGVDTSLMLRRALASARCLIVLDGFEQLTAAAPDIVDLIEGTSTVQILATSRRVLNVRGEYVFELGPLELPGKRGAPASAVELFIDRIAGVRPGFVPTDDDSAAIEELARRLDGLPLAIELAAAQMRVLTPAVLLERMGYRRLQLLASGPRDLPVRHQTLRETIAWSYDLLDPTERLLFERASVVVGSASLASIEAIANPEREFDTPSLLGSLVEASLVRAIGERGEVRFGMLETIREFAAERLAASGLTDRYQALHADHYRELAASGSLGLRGPDQLEWLDRLHSEQDNFRAALRRAIRRGDAASGARLGLLLAWYWQMRSLYAEGRAWMEAVRGMTGAAPRDRAAAWTVEAMLAVWQGEFEFLEAGVDDAIESLRDQGDASTLGLALLLRSAVAGVEGGEPAAQEAAAEASALLNTQGDAFLQAVTLLGRSYVARRLGRFDEVAALAEQALALSTSVGESYIRAGALAQLATAALEHGALADVRRHAADALIAARRLRNLSNAAYALELWAAAELQDGKPDLAGRLYALSERAYGLASAQPWRTDAPLHTSIAKGLQRALGPQLDSLLIAAREVDLDAAIADLASSLPGPADLISQEGELRP